MKTRREQLAYMTGLVKYSVDLGLAAAYQFGKRNGIKENIHVGLCSKGEQKAEWLMEQLTNLKLVENRNRVAVPYLMVFHETINACMRFLHEDEN
ncbi:hypothetical protein BAU26_04095 [Bacillus sp. N35-10-4]|uniref:hypothetical protein n=1 Tax=Bacillus sp. N35-10-4 TaxID=1866315 RepID=UPI0008FE6E58|nr:hypothetical protein [Bacillus sp. N35-10-4]OJD60783.1 hypothetical protein BAU26_04095 [Bacillus sp. N35-10-4]